MGVLRQVINTAINDTEVMQLFQDALNLMASQGEPGLVICLVTPTAAFLSLASLAFTTLTATVRIIPCNWGSTLDAGSWVLKSVNPVLCLRLH